MRRFRPDVIFSTGGYVCVPPIVAGKLLGIPSLTHEQTALVGLANRIAVAPTRDRLSSVGGGVRAAWGNRARLDLVLAVPLERAGLRTERPDPRLLVSLTTRLWPWSLR